MSGEKTPCCCAALSSPVPHPCTAAWSRGDWLGAMRARCSDRFRATFRVMPGLYAHHAPEPSSPVLVTANYALSFNHVRRALGATPAWILVLDTKGINVWCAAGKGSFGTEELLRRIGLVGLVTQVTHRRLIVPQLGAVGIAAHEVHKESGFSVIYGPVRSRDLPAFLRNGNHATPAMRRVRFTVLDRGVLVPIEIRPALQRMLPWLALLAGLAGLSREGVLFARMLPVILPLLAAAAMAVLAGTILHPLLLPLIPVRAFSLQGALLGALGAVGLIAADILQPLRSSIDSAAIVATIALSSYHAFLFTGCTTFTNPTGVKRELRLAWPFYRAAIGVCALLLAIGLFLHWRRV